MNRRANGRAIKTVRVWLLVAWAFGTSAQAGVSLSGTRLIFDGRFHEASLQARNQGARDVLIQAWLSAPGDDDDTPRAQRTAVPFLVTPHLQRLAAGGKQTLRVMYQGVGMPEKRESLLHLYVMQVPQRREGANQLNIAVRQRINVFYRPPGLQGDPAMTAERLRWELAVSASGAAVLRVSNPTAYHASLQGVSIEGAPLSEFLLLTPGAQQDLPLSFAPGSLTVRHLAFKAMTDYGGLRNYCARLSGAGPFNARLLDNTYSQEQC